MPTRFLPALTALLLLAPAARADDAGGRSFLAPVGEGTLTSSAGSARSGAEIHANTDSSKAYLKLGQTLAENGAFSTLAVTASAPLDKKSDATSLATLDGFTNAFTVEFKLTQFLTHRTIPDWRNHRPFYTRLTEAIAKGAVAEGDAKSPDEAKAMVVDTGNVLKYAPQLASEFESFTRDRSKWDQTWGVAATVGYQSLSYLTPPTLVKKSADKVPWGAKVFWGFLPGSDDTLVTLSFEYQQAYKDATAKTLVLPPDANGVQEAKTGAIGPPLDDRRQLAALEIRRLIRLREGGKPIGVNLKLTYDCKTEQFGVELPVWLVRDAKGNLTGGLALGWNEKNDRITLGVIVGGGFGFF